MLTLDTEKTFFNISNYESAEKEIALEREQHKLKKQICDDTVSGLELSVDGIGGSSDSIADSHIVSLEDSTPELLAVDSINVIINKMNAILFYSDKQIKKMQDFDTPNRIDYMQFLIKNQFKSIGELQTIVTLLLKVKKEEKAKNSIIMQSQTGNIRETIHKYIQKINKDMDLLSAFMLKLSSKEQIVIEYEKLDPDYFTNRIIDQEKNINQEKRENDSPPFSIASTEESKQIHDEEKEKVMVRD